MRVPDLACEGDFPGLSARAHAQSRFDVARGGYFRDERLLPSLRRVSRPHRPAGGRGSTEVGELFQEK